MTKSASADKKDFIIKKIHMKKIVPKDQAHSKEKKIKNWNIPNNGS
jgi:hypothetical protein